MKLPGRSRQPMVEIETDRFVLRQRGRWQLALATHGWMEDGEIRRNLSERQRKPSLYRWSRRFRRLDRGRGFGFLVYPKGGNRPVAYHAIRIDEGRAMLEVLVGDMEWWGKGLVQEIRQALFDYLFDVVGVRKLIGTPLSFNHASIFNYQRLGFRIEGQFRDHRVYPDGSKADVICFGLLRDEWREFRARESDALRKGEEP